jgi:capsular exopolysaccharide synthesis family protein
MSRIFDALQRSEAEQTGQRSSSGGNATELLQHAERRAASQWGTPAEPEYNGSGNGDQQVANDGPSGAQNGARSAAPTAVQDPQLREFPELFMQCQTLQVPALSQEKLITVWDKDSPAAEAFRLLAVRMRHIRRDRGLRKLLITSTIPQEGKSLVSANLTCTLSLRAQQRVVLLEGDLRRPSLTQLFELAGRPGMCEWLRGERDLAGCMYQFPNPRFWLLPAGSSAGNYLELLQSGRISKLIDEVSQYFDWVIVDSPPVLPLADTSIWSRLTDGILLVTRQGRTEKRQLQTGLDMIEREKLIGAVLNSSSSPAHGDYYYTQHKTDTSDLTTR